MSNLCLLNFSPKLFPCLTLLFYHELLEMGPTPFNMQQTIQHDAVGGSHLNIIIKATDIIGKRK